MQEMLDTEELQELRNAAEKAIREHKSERVISFIWNSRNYWIKRKRGNGRNQLVKYSVEKEFYYEIARRTIAKNACPDLVPDMPVLTPDYMVTEDGGMTVKSWLDRDIPEEEKREILRRAGTALCRLHRAGVVHGRPALRDITCRDGRISFLDWENRLYSRNPEEQKAIDFLLFLQAIYRENYPEEKGRIEAAESGYVEAGGSEVRKNAGAYLKKHGIVGKLVRGVSVFHWKDVEPVRKLYDHLL